MLSKNLLSTEQAAEWALRHDSATDIQSSLRKLCACQVRTTSLTKHHSALALLLTCCQKHSRMVEEDQASAALVAKVVAARGFPEAESLFRSLEW